MPVMIMAEDDAKGRIRDEAGDVSGIRLFGNKVLVAIYQRPRMTKSGILLADQTQAEDKYQGKVGLVLKLGPQAFVDDEKTKFGGEQGYGIAAIGDWVLFKTSETWPFDYNSKGGHCRMIDDIDIRAVIDQPDKVW